MSRQSIRFRLISWFAGLLLLVILGFGGYTYWRVKGYIAGVLANSLEHRAQQIASSLIGNISKTGEPFVRSEIEVRYAPELNDKFIRITRPDGSVLYRSGEPNDRSFTPEAVPMPAGRSPRLHTRELSLPGEERMLVAAQPYPAPQGTYLVEAGASLAGSDPVLQALVWTLAAGLLVVMALTVMGGWILIGKALAPVNSIMQAAQDITLHHLARRLPVPEGGDEIVHLSLVLNQMIARLDKSFQNTSRFTADASHELRTPLTIMRGELEELAGRADLTPQTREMVASLLEEVERLVRIVGGLFELSRLDTGEAQVERVKFDLANLAETTAEQMCLLAEEKQISLQCEAAGRVEVEGDRSRLKQVVVNLLDNAIKYTPHHGAVGIAVKTQNGTATIEIDDSGPGISEAALPHVWERFYRADEVHSSDAGGAGLGLSIVQSICAAHGGGVAIVNRPGGGCRVTVNLPRAR